MKLTIEVSPITTLVVYPDVDQVVWIIGGAEKKTCVTTLAQAEVIFSAEAYRRRREQICK